MFLRYLDNDFIGADWFNAIEKSFFGPNEGERDYNEEQLFTLVSIFSHFVSATQEK